jgi:hypothetical protein
MGREPGLFLRRAGRRTSSFTSPISHPFLCSQVVKGEAEGGDRSTRGMEGDPDLARLGRAVARMADKVRSALLSPCDSWLAVLCGLGLASWGPGALGRGHIKGLRCWRFAKVNVTPQA